MLCTPPILMCVQDIKNFFKEKKEILHVVIGSIILSQEEITGHQWYLERLPQATGCHWVEH